ncbi:hypothetical protein A0H81_04784 [Grifola frondosa]|uniref:F-box domain-containing protein n=1 Tax=Grifola frondosa TaxID=5627 RepID=A0A1C7MEI5_GRIFR|nr:hypothetical protein A0H81_04784 [Grifola frondosa]
MEKPKISSSSRIFRVDPDEDECSKQKSVSKAGTKRLANRDRDVGRLAHLLDMPLDIFFEIASQLKPVDILCLSRVSKDFRTLLMSKNARHVWIAARRNVSGLPDCPSDLAEPRYAFLIFERYCEACGVGKAVKVDYALRVRFCGACWKANVKKGIVLKQQLKLRDEGIYTLLPIADSIGNADLGVHNGSDLYYEPEFTMIAKQHPPVLFGKGLLEEFVKGRRALVKERQIQNTAIIQWESQIRQQKQAEERNIQQRRREAIEAKLIEEGYSKDEFPVLDDEWERMVDQPRELTARIWSRIGPELRGIIEREREEKAAVILKQKFRIRRFQLRHLYQQFLYSERTLTKKTMPCFEDAADLPCLKALIFSADPAEDLTYEEFNAVTETLVAEAEKYKRLFKQYLVFKITGEWPDQGATVKKLLKALNLPETTTMEAFTGMDRSNNFRCSCNPVFGASLGQILFHLQYEHDPTVPLSIKMFSKYIPQLVRMTLPPMATNKL